MATKVIIPTSATELEEMLSDTRRMKPVLSDPENFKEFIGNYVNASMKKDTDILAQVNMQCENFLTKWLKDQEADIPGLSNRLNMSHGKGAGDPRKGAVYNRKAAGVALDGSFESTSDFFRTIWHNSNALPEHEKLSAQFSKIRQVQNSFGSTIPQDGGFLIPEVLRSTLLEVALEKSITRSRATVIPMESLRVPIPAIDSTSNASSVYGGIVCYWTEEGGALVESQARFMRVVLEAKKLTAYAEMPNELIADATAFSGFFDAKFPLAINFYEDTAFITGNGVGQPLGWSNSGNGSLVTVAEESGQTANTIVWENIIKMYSRMLPSSLENAVWVVSPDTFPELATMALSVGTGGSAIWLNNGSQGPPMTILGRPVIVTEKVPALGSIGDINFVDLSYYLIGDRQVMQSMSSPHFKFGNDLTAFRIIQRVDGRPWVQSPITPANGSANTLSPFVQLGART